MNAYTRYRVLLCACLLLSYFAPQGYVYAGQFDFVEIPLEALHGEKPIELMGPRSQPGLMPCYPSLLRRMGIPGGGVWGRTSYGRQRRESGTSPDLAFPLGSGWYGAGPDR